MQATSLAQGIETSTACVSIGWEGMGEGKGVTVVRPVAAATQGPPWGIQALIQGGCAINLAKQHANVFKMHVQEVKLPFSHWLTPTSCLLELML